ncbi:MAG TPA: biotin transporter BioY [Terracidiphilus sp.]|nr:biotin transporter BioY [Terracidiphilus sp.]
MSKEISAQFAPGSALAAVPAARGSVWLRSGGIVLAGSAFAALCAHVALPLYFTPVPLSLTPFAVLLLGLLLSPRLAAATLGAYLVEGALGLPVFAPTPAVPGLTHLMGPTGGYLLAYPLAAALIAFLVRRTGRGFAPAFLSAATGSLVILACGAVWLAALTHVSVQSVFTLAILPFLPGDALKVAAAAALAAGWVRLRHRPD